MSLKKIFSLFFICLITAGACSACADNKPVPADTAVIRVKSQDTTRLPVRIMYTENNTTKFSLAAEPVQGIYEFRIPAVGYGKAALYITSPSNMIISGSNFTPQPSPQFLLKGGEEIHITTNFHNPLELSLQSEDPEILLFETYSRQERETNLQIWDLMKRRQADRDKEEIVSEMQAEIRKLSHNLNTVKKEFVHSHPGSFSALVLFESYYTQMDNQEALTRLQSLAKDYRDSPVWKGLFNKLTAAGNTGEGAIIPAFAAQDLNGRLFDSQKLNGKYLLIDFWGSWCQPCRESHPELKEIYQKYQPKGLEIVGIAYESGTLEKQLQQWKKAIREDQIDWIHILNTPENDLVKLFGITSYPTKILVDPNGKILSRDNSNSKALKNKLKEIFE